MKLFTTTLFLALILLTGIDTLAQQKESFDYTIYTAPAGWVKGTEVKNVVTYLTTNKLTGTYCRIDIYSSTTSKGNLQADFESEWQNLIVKNYNPSSKPEVILTTTENGWEVKGGVAPFQFSGIQSAATLITASGYGRCLSVTIDTNSDNYKTEIDKFIESVNLTKPETTQQVATTTINENTGSIMGTWLMSSSNQSSYRVNNGVMDYLVRQYILNTNGTYTFTSKAFDPLMDKIIFGKENGTYLIKGNDITIIPQKSILQSYSKLNGGDKFGKLLTSENRPLEKITYKFTKYYFSGIQEYSLVLQVSSPTKRDGPVSNNDTFTNAYYYSTLSPSHPLIDVP